MADRFATDEADPRATAVDPTSALLRAQEEHVRLYRHARASGVRVCDELLGVIQGDGDALGGPAKLAEHRTALGGRHPPEIVQDLGMQA